MQPIKDKSLHYFVITDSDNQFSYTTSGFYEKKSTLELLKKSEMHGFVDFFVRPGFYPHVENGRIDMKQADAKHFLVPFFVKYMEPVIDLKSYQHSVDFTIGSSKRNKEPRKYLVGIDLKTEILEGQINRIKESYPWYKISFDDFDKIPYIEGERRYMSFDSIKRYDFCFPKTEIDSKILAHAGNTKDVSDYSYDDLFKYYILIS